MKTNLHVWGFLMGIRWDRENPGALWVWGAGCGESSLKDLGLGTSWRRESKTLWFLKISDTLTRRFSAVSWQPYFHGPSGDARGSKKLQLTGATLGAGSHGLGPIYPHEMCGEKWGKRPKSCQRIQIGWSIFLAWKIRWWQTGRPPMNSLAARMCLKDDWLSVFGIPLVIVPWKKGLLTFQSANFNCHWKTMVSWMYVWNTFYWLMDVNGFITCHGPHPIWDDPRNGQTTCGPWLSHLWCGATTWRTWPGRGCRRKGLWWSMARSFLMLYIFDIVFKLNLKWIEILEQSSSVHPLVPENHMGSIRFFGFMGVRIFAVLVDYK